MAFDHDRLFKELLRTFFWEFLELFFPHMVQYVDRESIEFLDKEIFTDVMAGDRHEVDLLVKARFKGRETFFLIHVENQAHSQEAFSKRMFHYFARLDEKFNLPIYPIALLSYDAPTRPEPERYQVAFPDMVVLEFNFAAIQLNRLNWRDYLRRPNPVASALMTKMKIAVQDRPRVKLECLRMLATLHLDKARSALIGTFMNNYLKLSDEENRVYNQELQSIAPPEQEAVMNYTNEWIEEGVEKGIHQGRQEGLANMALRVLARRLGPLPSDLTQRMHQLSSSQLEELGEALLEFRGINDVEEWLAAHA